MAALANQRTIRFVHHPWMNRLAVAVAFDLLVDWLLLGMAFNHIHNAWLSNLALVPQFFLSLWVLSGLGSPPLSTAILAPSAVAVLGAACLEATSSGLGSKWTATMTISNFLLLALCLWILKDFIFQTNKESTYRAPKFWLLCAWVLAMGSHLTFDMVANVFLHRLPTAWILVPWFGNYLVGFFLSLTLSRTFLCPRFTSS